MNTRRTNTKRPNTVKVVGVELDGVEDVYNMEVLGTHNFAVNGGLIVHNCMDATRYMVKTLCIAQPKKEYKSIMRGML